MNITAIPISFFYLQAPQGYIGTSGIYTQKQGFGMADFMLGDVSTVLYNTALVVHQLLPGHSVYGQDTWRFHDNLTVTYGARYELYAPLLNRTNSVANFSPQTGAR